MTKIKVDRRECEGSECAYCVFTCPMEIFMVENDQIFIKNTEKCNSCEMCIYICPNDAIMVGEG
ncbi:MAG: 4Fe-4S dicluster domain-containing protein [Euryarchaeota archaeon]|nr:4Fe-4S dicluster domain-containing protein [Euryarchaeota archaeon]